MRLAFASLAALAAIGALVAFSLPATADQSVGGQEVGYSVEGMRRDVNAAGADAGAESKDLAVGAKAPTCTIHTKTETHAPSGECDSGAVSTNVPDALLNVNVFVGFGRIEDAPADAPPAMSLASVANGGFLLTPTGAIVAAAAAGASALAAYGVWRALKLLGLGAAIPLYSHISDDELLDDENRARIFSLIRDVPGISTKDVADRLGLAWGTVTHHLAKLEKRRMVVSKKYGKYRRYFVNGAMPQTEQKDALAVMRVPATAEVANFIKANPGWTQKHVSQALGVSSSTILWHVKRLEQVGVVSKIRDGKTVKYFAAEGAAGAAFAQAAVALPPTPASAAPLLATGPAPMPAAGAFFVA